MTTSWRRIQHLKGGQDAVGARRQARIGQNGQAAGLLDRVDDRDVARRHRHRTDSRRLGLAQHAHDHRHPADIGQRLVGKAGGRHAGRNDDDGVHERPMRVKTVAARLRPGR
jgi:hypothetical protein